MSNTAKGRFPYNSAYGFKAKISNLRQQVREPLNTYALWQDWFLGSDGIGFGTFKRWNGSIWVECTKFNVNAF